MLLSESFFNFGFYKSIFFQERIVLKITLQKLDEIFTHYQFTFFKKQE